MNDAEFVVQWNGAVDGPNRGLLCCAADVTRPAPPLLNLQALPRLKARPSTSWMLEAVRKILIRRAMTVDQLSDALGLSVTQVQHALRRLRREGVLVSWQHRADPQAAVYVIRERQP